MPSNQSNDPERPGGSRRPRGPRRRWLAALALLTALVLAEGAARALFVRAGMFRGRPLPPFGVTTHPRQRQWLAEQRARQETTSEGDEDAFGPGVFDAQLGWTHADSFRSADGKICTNSQGARGVREYARERPASVLRATCFGDSFTWCDQVIDAESWPAELEELRPELEVLNFGMSGFGTDQALLRFEQRGRGLGAQITWIGIMLENIGRNVNRYRPLWYPKSGACVAKPRFVLEQDTLRLVPLPYGTQLELVNAIEGGRVLRELGEHEYWSDASAPWLEHSALARLASAFFAYRRRSVPRLWADRGGEPYRTTLALLERFHGAARAAGAQLVAVLVFPREDDLDAFRGNGPYWRALLADLDRRGIEAIDLTAPLARALSGSSVETPSSSLYTGGHLNARGNAIVARTLAEWVDANRGRCALEDSADQDE